MSSPPSPQQIKLSVSVPRDAVGFIIGKRGETVRNMMTKSSAHIAVDRADTNPAAPDRLFHIQGDREAVNTAKALIKEKVLAVLHGNPHLRATDPSTTTAQPDQRMDILADEDGPPPPAPLEMWIPHGCVGMIIGHGGQVINEMQERAGATIVVHNNKVDRNRAKLLTISGGEREKSHARDLIQSVLDRAGLRTRLSELPDPPYYPPPQLPHAAAAAAAVAAAPPPPPPPPPWQFQTSYPSYDPRPDMMPYAPPPWLNVPVPTPLYTHPSNHPHPNMYHPWSPPPYNPGPPYEAAPPPQPQQIAMKMPTKAVCVPSSCVGIVIGRSGETIRDLQNRSGAYIKVTPDREARDDDLERVIYISGPPAALELAHSLVNDVINEGLSRNYRDGVEPRAQSEEVGGEGGKKVAAAAAAAAATTTTTTTGKKLQGGDEEVSREGRDENIDYTDAVNFPSLAAVRDSSSKEREAGRESDCDKSWKPSPSEERGRRQQQEGSDEEGEGQGSGNFTGEGRLVQRPATDYPSPSISFEMKIPNAKVGVIIGKSGSTIRMLQQQSGARIVVSKKMDTTQEDNPRAVTITGPQPFVDAARRLIVSKLNPSDDNTSANKERDTPPPDSSFDVEEAIDHASIDALATDLSSMRMPHTPPFPHFQTQLPPPFLHIPQFTSSEFRRVDNHHYTHSFLTPPPPPPHPFNDTIRMQQRFSFPQNQDPPDLPAAAAAAAAATLSPTMQQQPLQDPAHEFYPINNPNFPAASPDPPPHYYSEAASQQQQHSHHHHHHPVHPPASNPTLHFTHDDFEHGETSPPP